MENCYYSNYEELTVDLHSMKVWDAWNYLDRLIEMTPKGVNEIVVIHGYNNGTSLMNMVRKEYKNDRVSKKYISWNEGRTSLILS